MKPYADIEFTAKVACATRYTVVVVLIFTRVAPIGMTGGVPPAPMEMPNCE